MYLPKAMNACGSNSKKNDTSSSFRRCASAMTLTRSCASDEPWHKGRSSLYDQPTEYAVLTVLEIERIHVAGGCLHSLTPCEEPAEF